MATLEYIVQPGDDIFSIASSIYVDFPSGLTDLMTLNNISIGSALPSKLTYTPGLTRIVPKYNIPIINNPEQKFTVRNGQSAYDLAIQLYGNFEGIAQIIPLMSNLDTDLNAGTVISYPEDLLANNTLFLKNIVASKTNIGYIETETGFHILLEDDSGAILKE